MPRLIWTPQALADVSRLRDFLLAHDPELASRAIRAIRDGLALLEQHPHAGRLASGMENGTREWSIHFGHRGYVALYRQDGDKTVILAIRHAREAGYSGGGR